MKQYMLDTNCIRYTVSKNKHLKKASKRFFQMVEEEKKINEVHLVIPEEVKEELINQMYGFREVFHNEREIENIEAFLPQLKVVPNDINYEEEKLIRRMAAIVTTRYRTPLTQEINKNFRFPSASDARILGSALKTDSVMVTNNTREFILLLFLAQPKQQILYDLEEGQYLKISQTLYDLVWNDPEFTHLYNDLNKCY
ncbi:hypothetical protein AJ85_03940 [Alkalihalobacillus alcalophilus ATCC 27647 = CGMCC 1.3604]|uniref:PIN domain-containing protein n=1 Tax=Alkalihalobacillus alcalophilus ATCC 27647 = CGMCC 1.3604 TaxID=1218173 RepID=A0A094WQT3_ALKAL|nr:DUF4411 family protein [Alkalihalobacillus alcalophilus]KGA98398.1 hypothetical protein BALCAV_0204790 [Alkalihalobacillus alcalophilus ATCC 27647 = CGMCC 1.3604]MED1563934.1 DUF4411 family protein [Alkalihalobacillus alcalophilus]THG91622.1 hypothetical protein AJ85_03940 [Alkalihalobacillus alcalophilus ATCC 27647 = CGMCC 1.3604]